MNFNHLLKLNLLNLLKIYILLNLFSYRNPGSFLRPCVRPSVRPEQNPYMALYGFISYNLILSQTLGYFWILFGRFFGTFWYFWLFLSLFFHFNFFYLFYFFFLFFLFLSPRRALRGAQGHVVHILIPLCPYPHSCLSGTKPL